MTRARLLVCIAGALGVAPLLSAQSPRLESRVPAPILAAVTPIIDSARAAGPPSGPLEQQGLGGVTKQAGASRMAAALSQASSPEALREAGDAAMAALTARGRGQAGASAPAPDVSALRGWWSEERQAGRQP